MGMVLLHLGMQVQMQYAVTADVATLSVCMIIAD